MCFCYLFISIGCIIKKKWRKTIINIIAKTKFINIKKKKKKICTH